MWAGSYRNKGESERKAVWGKDNELRFRDVEFGDSEGRLGGDDSKCLKMCLTSPQSSLFQLGTFLRDRKQMGQTAGLLIFSELSSARTM